MVLQTTKTIMNALAYRNQICKESVGRFAFYAFVVDQLQGIVTLQGLLTPNNGNIRLILYVILILNGIPRIICYADPRITNG